MTVDLAGKRFLIVARATTLHANAGGMETSAEALVRALQEIGVRTALLTTALGEGTFPEGYQSHDHLWTIKTRRPGRYSRTWWRRAQWREPWADWSPDAVLGIGDAGRAFLFGRSRSPVPVITHAHGTTLMEIRSALAARSLAGYVRAVLNLLRTPSRIRYLNRVDLAIAAGPAIRASLQAWPYSLQAKVVTVVSNSVDSDIYRFDLDARNQIRRKYGVDETTPFYLYLGRLAPDKGVAWCIQLAAAAPNCQLFIVGDGPSGRALRALARERRLEHRVRFVGRVEPSETARWMSAADQMWLLTDRHEGLPMVLLEAAANGVPVLTTPRAQLPSDIRTGAATVRDATRIDLADLLEPGQGHVEYLPAEYQLSTLPSRLGNALCAVFDNDRVRA